MKAGRRLKTFREYLAKVEAEQLYLVLIVPDSLVVPSILTEQWQAAGHGDLVYRVDPANAATKGERHIHIAHRKHKRVKDSIWGDRYVPVTASFSLSDDVKARARPVDFAGCPPDTVQPRSMIQIYWNDQLILIHRLGQPVKPGDVPAEIRKK